MSDLATQETTSQTVVGWEPSMPPTDLIFDDGEPLESNRHRIAINVLIRSLQQAYLDRNNFLPAVICLSITAVNRRGTEILEDPISLPY